MKAKAMKTKAKKRKKIKKLAGLTAKNATAIAFLSQTETPSLTPITLKVRIKDRHAKSLLRLSRLVNRVWNLINEQTEKGWLSRRHWPSGYDMEALVTGLTKEEGWQEIGQQSLNQVAIEHAVRRNQFKKAKLNWRVSDPSRKNYSPGWVPFKRGNVKLKNGALHYRNFRFEFMESGYDLSQYKLLAGSFNEDKRARWYCNMAVEHPVTQRTGGVAIGIDPGRWDVMTASTGEKIAIEDLQYPDLEKKRAKVQMAKKTGQRMGSVKRKRYQSLNSKIANKRKQALFDYANLIAKQASVVFIGHWAPPAQGKADGAKEARDGSLATLKTILAQKCEQYGVPVFEVNEMYTSKTCHDCGAIKDDLTRDIRAWTCEHCGTDHDRDLNAANNICKTGKIEMGRALALLAAEAQKRREEVVLPLAA